MRETEWKVVCAAGHKFYERIHHPPGTAPDDVQFSDCPKCGGPRRGKQLPPIEVPRQADR